MVIVAAGRGERAGQVPTARSNIAGSAAAPVIAHTLDAFLAHPAIGPIVVVIHPDDDALFDARDR